MVKDIKVIKKNEEKLRTGRLVYSVWCLNLG